VIDIVFTVCNVGLFKFDIVFTVCNVGLFKLKVFLTGLFWGP
jgi:hypothetical protein